MIGLERSHLHHVDSILHMGVFVPCQAVMDSASAPLLSVGSSPVAGVLCLAGPILCSMGTPHTRAPRPLL